MSLKFVKMQACGNDYIYIDNFDGNIKDGYDLAVKLSKRRFSVGADGLILIGKCDGADGKMTMYNADGTEGKMCGNAVRCVAKYLADDKGVAREHIYISTRTGVKECTVNGNYVTTRLGAKFARFPVHEKLKNCPFIDEIYTVNVGNDHVVCNTVHGFLGSFERKNAHIDRLFADLGQNLPYNVEICEKTSNDSLSVRVLERGSGETFACGTGACASVFALFGGEKQSKKISVAMKGGALDVTVSNDKTILLGGEVFYCFFGEIND